MNTAQNRRRQPGPLRTDSGLRAAWSTKLKYHQIRRLARSYPAKVLAVKGPKLVGRRFLGREEVQDVVDSLALQAGVGHGLEDCQVFAPFERGYFFGRMHDVLLNQTSGLPRRNRRAERSGPDLPASNLGQGLSDVQQEKVATSVRLTYVYRTRQVDVRRLS